eukprot:2778277-Amphidinium_carterae.2
MDAHRSQLGEVVRVAGGTATTGCSFGNLTMMLAILPLLEKHDASIKRGSGTGDQPSHSVISNMVDDLAGFITGDNEHILHLAHEILGIAHGHLAHGNLQLSDGKCVVMATKAKLLQEAQELLPPGKHQAVNNHRLLGVQVWLTRRRRIKMQRVCLKTGEYRRTHMRQLRRVWNKAVGQNMGLAPRPLKHLRGRTIRSGHNINRAAQPEEYLQAIDKASQDPAYRLHLDTIKGWMNLHANQQLSERKWWPSLACQCSRLLHACSPWHKASQSEGWAHLHVAVPTRLDVTDTPYVIA